LIFEEDGMSKTLKIILIILGITILIGAGFGLARWLAPKPNIEHQYQFSVQVNAIGDIACVLTPASLVLNKGDTGTITITTSASGGFDGQIYFAVSGLPVGSYSFSKSPVNPGETVTLSINSALLATNTGYVCRLIAADGPIVFEE
jgi:hypothetical protein